MLLDLLKIPGVRKMVFKVGLSVAEKKALKIAEKVIQENSSIASRSQSGMSGATPLPDTAPLTGGPRISPDVSNTKAPELEYVNDWDALNYEVKSSGSLSDFLNDSMRSGSGSTGDSYGRKKV